MTDIQDIQTAASALVSATKDSSLIAINKWQGRSVDMFTWYYMEYNKLKSDTSVACTKDDSANGAYYDPISDLVSSLYTFSKFLNDSFVPYFNIVHDNLSLLSDDSQKWWNDTFNDQILVANSDYKMSIITFARNLSMFTDDTKPCPEVQQGSNVFMALEVMYNCTPWDNTSIVYKAFMDTANYSK